MENNEIIAVVLITLALIMAILSTPIRTAFNDLFEGIGIGMIMYWLPGDILLLFIEVGLLVLIIATAIYGQRVSKV
ncbi:MAG: hypothetical protein JSW11_04020 [Candidatus Heimdallarchaeota archaeon]|nr:MAG: hypothetical protein JSW11_04020 [Candidatus Heimdallarchaeota archaeon]